MQICTFNIPCFVIVSSIASRQISIWKLHLITKLDYFCQMCKLTLDLVKLVKKKDFLAFLGHRCLTLRDCSTFSSINIESNNLHQLQKEIIKTS
jgi:hypothetical protein